MSGDAFKALSDPTRREVLRLLRRGEVTAGELAAHFPVAAATMSHHFKVLREAGLIADRREGTQVFYSLNTTVVQELLATLVGLFSPTGAPATPEVPAEEEPS
jgi:DNA-binding transcriptional ArsR family regulator